ncbi:MAG: hypothetical protein JW751_02600 [Polyangiaceae bacterium]|nr:hypothetical protein [Polyangiaceae bacterium]
MAQKKQSREAQDQEPARGKTRSRKRQGKAPKNEGPKNEAPKNEGPKNEGPKNEAKGAAKSEYNDTHYCLAFIDVRTRKAQEFEEHLAKTTALFNEQGWTMQLDLELDEFAVCIGGASWAHPTKYLHLWKMENLDSLLRVMATAADNADYAELDQLVRGEEQNLAVGAPYDPLRRQGTRRPRKFDYYLLEELDMTRSRVARLTFRTAMNHAKLAMKKAYGWKLCYALIFATGTINRYAHVWGVPRQTRDEAVKFYRRLHDDGADLTWRKPYQAAVKTWEQSWWFPADADPG